MAITHHDIDTNGIRLHVAACGPEDGPLVILLHGFPEYWGAWEVHMGLLAAQGYRVMAPDQRGYNTSDKPPRIRDYGLELLAGDVVGLVDHAGRSKARVVGHDWGGAVAWHVARMAPSRVEQLVVVNCPPADLMQRIIWRYPSQLFRSWYIMAMQMPAMAEWFLSWGNHAQLHGTMIGSSTPGTFTEDSLQGHRDAWAQPGALHSMINWYRASTWNPPRLENRRVEVPTLLLWGEQDRFLGTGLVDPSMAICDDGRAIRYPDATHWLPHEKPEEIVGEMVSFFGGQTEEPVPS